MSVFPPFKNDVIPIKLIMLYVDAESYVSHVFLYPNRSSIAPILLDGDTLGAGGKIGGNS